MAAPGGVRPRRGSSQRSAMVTERISNDADTGCVKLEGETWTARAYEEDVVIEPGRRVHVIEIRGATALVTEE